MSVADDPTKWTLNLLRTYCERHGLKKTGKKAAVCERVLAHRNEGQIAQTASAGNGSDDAGEQSGKEGKAASTGEAAVTPEEGCFPMAGWMSLAAGRLQSAAFTLHTMCVYFLDTVASDGKSTANFKAIAATDSKSLRLFQRGFVKNIELVVEDGIVFYRAKCEPEMRSASPYKLKLAVKVGASDEDNKVVERVVFAECRPCPAGKAPRASCKHLAALMFALEEFTRLGFARDPLMCTDTLQAWNKPHKRKAEPVLACELDWGKKGKEKRRKRTAAELSDP